jgi:hypothetical protein
MLRAVATLFCLSTLGGVADANGKWCAVAKWRGEHKSAELGEVVGLCTAELVAKDWIITAAHCATRVLKKEPVHVQLTFSQSNKPEVKRGIKSCHKCIGMDVDVVLCKLSVPVNAFAPFTLNSDLYRTNAPAKKGKGVYTVGTSGGYHEEGPKALEYEGNGAHLYVHKADAAAADAAAAAGGLGMKAGDSGGAWVHEVHNGGKAQYLLSGVIHGGSSSRGIAAQVSFMRSWIDKTTNSTAQWGSASAGNGTLAAGAWH